MHEGRSSKDKRQSDGMVSIFEEEVMSRDVEAEAGSGSGGSGTFSVEAEGRKIHRFRFHIRGKNGERKEIGSAILCRITNGGEHKH